MHSFPASSDGAVRLDFLDGLGRPLDDAPLVAGVRLLGLPHRLKPAVLLHELQREVGDGLRRQRARNNDGAR